MSLAYLSKYLNKESNSKLKRKRTSQVIKEDDLTGWKTLQDDQDDTVAKHEPSKPVKVSSGFKPAYVVESSADSTPAMASGARAGLQTKAQVEADIQRKREKDKKEFEQARALSTGQEHETVYRDATGRRIDIALARQEKARELKREQERKKKEKDLGSGLVQKRQQATRLKELEQVKNEGFSRYAGDEASERFLKEVDRWNDPAAEFLTRTKKPQLGKPERRLQYQGGFPPNRYGIRPGYRWDGVDRGNGYEKKRFQREAESKAFQSRAHDWSVEDM